MNKLRQVFVFTLLASLSWMAHAQRPQNTFDAYMTCKLPSVCGGEPTETEVQPVRLK
jgi:hypothetical protein